jgi:hypothetical protein
MVAISKLSMGETVAAEDFVALQVGSLRFSSVGAQFNFLDLNLPTERDPGAKAKRARAKGCSTCASESNRVRK